MENFKKLLGLIVVLVVCLVAVQPTEARGRRWARSCSGGNCRWVEVRSVPVYTRPVLAPNPAPAPKPKPPAPVGPPPDQPPPSPM